MCLRPQILGTNLHLEKCRLTWGLGETLAIGDSSILISDLYMYPLTSILSEARCLSSLPSHSLRSNSSTLPTKRHQ